MFINKFPRLKRILKIPYVKLHNYILNKKESRKYDYLQFLGKNIKVLKLYNILVMLWEIFLF